MTRQFAAIEQPSLDQDFCKQTPQHVSGQTGHIVKQSSLHL
jgi:hypothetical protein